MNKKWLIVAGLALALAQGCFAQEFPNRPIKVVVGYVPGGAADFVARTIADRLSQVLRQPVIIENRPGAGGSIAAEAVARAAPDGYTLLLSETGSLEIAPYVTKSLRYDPRRDFTPISFVAGTPVALVTGPALAQVNSVSDLVREAKNKQGKLAYGSSGVGSIHQFAMEALKADAGFAMTHIPYKGSGQSIPALLSGDIAAMMTSLTAILPHVKAGNVKLIAVTSATRFPGTPDVPTVAEEIKGYEFAAEFGVCGPAKLPPNVVSRLSDALKETLASAQVQEKFAAASFVASWSAPDAYAEKIAVNLKKYERATKLANIVPE